VSAETTVAEIAEITAVASAEKIVATSAVSAKKELPEKEARNNYVNAEKS
jgi:hypothetical protein